MCPSDVDTTIVKKSLQVQDKPATVLADDTDILCLRLHHIYYSNKKNKIYTKTKSAQTKSLVSYNIHDIINSTENEYLEHVLFCHAFTGCNTTSKIYNFGKKSIFSKVKMSKDLQHLSKQFYQNSVPVNETGNASI